MIARYEFTGLDNLYKKLVLGYRGTTREYWEKKNIDYCLWHLNVLVEDAKERENNLK